MSRKGRIECSKPLTNSARSWNNIEKSQRTQSSNNTKASNKAKIVRNSFHVEVVSVANPIRTAAVKLPAVNLNLKFSLEAVQGADLHSHIPCNCNICYRCHYHNKIHPVPGVAPVRSRGTSVCRTSNLHDSFDKKDGSKHHVEHEENCPEIGKVVPAIVQGIRDIATSATSTQPWSWRTQDITHNSAARATVIALQRSFPLRKENKTNPLTGSQNQVQCNSRESHQG